MRSLHMVVPRLASELAAELGAVQEGPDQPVEFLCAVSDLQPGALCFASSGTVTIEPAVAGGVILCTDDLVAPSAKVTLLRVASPRLAFARIGHSCSNVSAANVSPHAIIDPTAKIDPSARVEHGAVIGPRCVLDRNVVIGFGTVLVSDVTIHDGVVVGHNSVLGDHGFGFERDPITDEVFRIPHVGGVTVGRRTQIGSLVTIARGTFGDTTIGEYCQVDSMSFIAHNAQIGDRCTIVCLVGVAGSVQIGEDVWVGPQSMIRDGLTVGAGSMIGMGSVVTKSVAAGVTVYGNPAREAGAK
jgi:UDP-3-O-[3-hydroxymyristoyl] glucosamine N-acyltransferase LpxD